MKIFCVNCKNKTNHVIKHELKKNFEDDINQIWYEDTWQIIECNGCEEISFRECNLNSEDRDPESGDAYENEKIYPLRDKENLPLKNYYNVPRNIRNIYRQTIDAYNNNLLILCAGGIRAILEGICNYENILFGTITSVRKDGTSVTKNSKNLDGKINGLHEVGLLTKNHAVLLHEHRFIGNEALHSLEMPSKKELKMAINIIEHTLDNIYEITEITEELRHQRKSRKIKLAKK
jgi:hypothetical protein